jgi:hypothetical protein
LRHHHCSMGSTPLSQSHSGLLNDASPSSRLPHHETGRSRRSQKVLAGEASAPPARRCGAASILGFLDQNISISETSAAPRLVKSLLKNYEHPPAMHIALGWCRYYLSDTWLNLPHTGFEALRASRIFQRQTDGERPTQNIE